MDSTSSVGIAKTSEHPTKGTAESVREELARVSREIYRSGLTYSTGGNISVRQGDILFISKANTAFSRLQGTDIIICDLQGNPLEEGKPSKEVGFHAAIYQQRPDVGAVVHLHSPYSIALGALPLVETDALPYCTYGAVARVGRVPLVEFYAPGHPDLIRRVAQVTPQAENAIYLAKHGVISFGKNLSQACDIAEEFEQNAKIFVMTGGKVPLLTAEEIAVVRQREGKR